MQLTYVHDGSHPETYRGWARMVGHVTEVRAQHGQRSTAGSAPLNTLATASPTRSRTLLGSVQRSAAWQGCATAGAHGSACQRVMAHRVDGSSSLVGAHVPQPLHCCGTVPTLAAALEQC